MIKEFKDDGYRFMCKCTPGSISVFDIDIDDDVEQVEFEGFDEVAIGKKAEKSFPNVKTLVIGGEVEYISIPNEMFPNVRNVISYNKHFLSSDMLIRKVYNVIPNKNGKHTETWLLNTFCKTQDEVIDLKSVECIGEYAFCGCRSTKLINEGGVEMVRQFAFSDSAFLELEPVDGAYMAGSMIIEFDENAKELVIPETATYFLRDRYDNKVYKKYDKIIVRNSSLFFKHVLHTYAAPKNLVIDCEVYEDEADFCDYVGNSGNLQNLQITDKSERYITYDGVLYDKSGKVLLTCPTKKQGTVKIKEGAERIASKAFFSAAIEEVEMPDSVKTLGRYAFYNCQKLKSVKLSNSLMTIPDYCFSINTSLREIRIPDNVMLIGEYAFSQSGLENIHFGKSVKVIQYAALMSTKLKELRFPASVKELQNIGPAHVTDVYLETLNIPENFCDAIAEIVPFSSDLDTVYMHDSQIRPYVIVHMPGQTVYFPSYLLSNIESQLNNFVNDYNAFPPNMFQYAPNAKVMKCKIALAEYKNLNSDIAKEYLSKNIINCVKAFINIKDEAALIDLLCLHLVENADEFNKIMQLLPENMVSAKAYLLSMSSDFTLIDLSC